MPQPLGGGELHGSELHEGHEHHEGQIFVFVLRDSQCQRAPPGRGMSVAATVRKRTCLASLFMVRRVVGRMGVDELVELERLDHRLARDADEVGERSWSTVVAAIPSSTPAATAFICSLPATESIVFLARSAA
jgi:hypothetical protein